jgi:16S rRNA C1402 N4-methylase RsmH
MDNTSFHIPVLKSDSIQQLITDENGIYIDATLRLRRTHKRNFRYNN